MAVKKCAVEHCEETFETKGARKFCDECAGVKKPKVPKKPISINEDCTRFLVPLMVDEHQLDDFWAKLPIEEKALAIQLYWDNSNSPEETKTSAPTPETNPNS